MNIPTRALLVATLAAACAHKPAQYPLTQQGQLFTDLDQTEMHGAPPVAASVTSARIANGRSEPQNWLTYYGAYDGQRFSSLDQINARNVARLKPAWVFQAGVIEIG